MGVLIVQLQKLELMGCYKDEIGILVKMDAHKRKYSKEKEQFQGLIKCKGSLSFDLSIFGEVSSFGQIITQIVLTVSFTAQRFRGNLQNLIHTQKVNLKEILHSKKRVTKFLDSFFGQQSLIQFTIQYQSKFYFQPSNHHNLNTTPNDYQLNSKDSNFLKLNSSKQHCFSSPNMTHLDSSSKMDFFNDKSNLLSQNNNKFGKDYFNDHRRQVRIKNYKLSSAYGLEKDMQSNNSERTFKIQHKEKQNDKIIEDLRLEKQTLIKQRKKIDNTVKNLSQKMLNLEKKKSKAQSKSLETQKQLKNSLRQTRDLKNKNKYIQNQMQNKDKRIKQLERKVQINNDAYMKKQVVYKLQLQTLSAKLSDMAHDKQKIEFQLERTKNFLQQKDKMLEELRNKKGQRNEVNIVNEDVIKESAIVKSKLLTMREQNQAINNEIKVLQKKLSSSENQVIHFKDLISEQGKQIQKMKDQISQLITIKKQKILLEMQIQSLNQQILFFNQSSLSNNPKQTPDKQEETQILIRQVTSLKQQIHNKIQETTQINYALNNKSKELSKILVINLDLKQQITNSIHQNSYINKKYQQTLRQLSQQQSNITIQKSQLLQKIQRLQQDNREKEGFLIKNSQNLKLLKTQIQQLKINENKQKHSHEKQLHTIIQNNQRQVKNLKMQHDKLLSSKLIQLRNQQEKKSSQKEFILMEHNTQKLNQVKSHFQTLIQNTQLENNNLQQKIHALNVLMQDKLEKKNIKIEELNQKLSSQKQQLTSTSAHLQLLTLQYDQLLFGNKILKEQLNRNIPLVKNLKQSLSQSQALNQQYTQTIQESSQALSDTKNVVKELQFKLEQQILKKNKISCQNYQLKNLLDGLQKEKQSLEEKYLELIQVNAKLRQESAIIKQQSSHQNEIQTKTNNLQQLIDQKIKVIKEIQKEIKSLKAKQESLVQVAKNQLAVFCKEDNKRLITALQKFQKVRQQLKVNNESTALSLETVKKLDRLETQLQNQHQVMTSQVTQLKSKQIEIQGMKVKYNKYKQENEKLANEIQAIKIQSKKSRIQCQNIIIALGQTKKQVSQVEDQLINKGIAQGSSLKMTSAFNLVKQSIRKVQALVTLSTAIKTKSVSNVIDRNTIVQYIANKSPNNKIAHQTKLKQPSNNLVSNVQSKKIKTQLTPLKETQNKIHSTSQLHLPLPTRKNASQEEKNLDQQLNLSSRVIQENLQVIPPLDYNKHGQKPIISKNLLTVHIKQSNQFNLSTSMIEIQNKSSMDKLQTPKSQPKQNISINSIHKNLPIFQQSIFFVDQVLKVSSQSKNNQLIASSYRSDSQIKKKSEIISLIYASNQPEKINIQLSIPKQKKQEYNEEKLSQSQEGKGKGKRRGKAADIISRMPQLKL